LAQALWKSDLLIMDEPTNDFGFETIEWVEIS
jgi:ATPase subunit of ABC transporter with duplicated ATPase domains